MAEVRLISGEQRNPGCDGNTILKDQKAWWNRPHALRRFRKQLLAWFRTNARDLPWRRTRDPYHILVAEVMLQQTQTQTVLRYYKRFLDCFPTVQALASAPEAEILKQWAGLGYYRRARNLQRAAQQIVALGRFPGTYEELRKLPGVGDYTASAVASIAFNRPHAVLDGNVRRVLSRLSACPFPVDSSAGLSFLEELASRLLDREHPGTFNQAMMELGSLVCIPGVPICSSCAVRFACEAFKTGRPEAYPVTRRRGSTRRVETTLLVIVQSRKVALLQRDHNSSKLAGFWELPSFDQCPQAKLRESIGEFSHSITSTRYRVRVYTAEAPIEPPLQLVPVSSLSHLPLATMTRKALKLAGLVEA